MFNSILIDGLTTANIGEEIGLRGERIALGAGKAKTRYGFPIEVVTSASGAAASTATVLLEVSRGDRMVITGLTAANPGVVTAVAHGFASGDKVTLWNLVGMEKLNGQTVTVTKLTADTFSIGVDTTAYTAYSSAGVAQGPWVVWDTLTFVIPTSAAPVPLKRVGKLSSVYDYIRGRVSAISGCTINSYVMRKG